jgi:hypothetical protein
METIKDIDWSHNMRILVRVSKDAFESEGLLEDYISRRGKYPFDDKGYDYLSIFQAAIFGFFDQTKLM